MAMTRFDILADTGALSGSRQVSWQVTLLSRTGEEIGLLDGVTGGSVSVSSTTRLRGSGTLEVRDLGQEVDWLSDRVRLTYTITGGPSWDVGVFLLAAPKREFGASGAARSIELSGVLGVLDEDTTTGTYVVPAGTLVTDRVRQIIEATGERAAVTPSDQVTSSALMWDPGTPWLTVANHLLDTINYLALDVDETGAVMARPYTAPQSRPIMWAFTEGALAVHSPDWGLSQDLGSVPNRVVLTSQADGEEEPLTAVAENDDPASAWGYQARGRWITHVEDGVEAASQAVLDALAQRRLVSLASPSATIEASCLPLPLRPLDAIAWDTAGHASRAVIQEVSMDLTATSLMKMHLLEVAG